MGEGVFFLFSLLSFFTIAFVWKTFIVVPAREKVIKERLGKFIGVLEPGFHFMIPLVDRAAYRQEMREQAIDVPSQSCITKDNIQVEVDGIVYLKVEDAKRASYEIGSYRSAAINLAQTTMRSEIGKMNLDDTFSERDSINHNIVREIDKASDPWGVKVIRYEIMNITPSYRVVDTMEKQMEAERQKRADIVLSSGQKQAAINISEGERQQAVSVSEGNKAKRINEARGRADAIRIVADASAQALNMVADAIHKPGGEAAIKMQLTEQFVDELGGILKEADVSVVPEGLANIKGFFQGVNEVGGTMNE
ncbi:MAG: paraslipin [Deltaproteobacteria bacterium]|nr:paraslipin [Deltaproteobacteria bacterium]